jgi:hypothetical protein
MPRVAIPAACRIGGLAGGIVGAADVAAQIGEAKISPCILDNRVREYHLIRCGIGVFWTMKHPLTHSL